MAISAQARFEALQAKWRSANEAATDLLYALQRTYGDRQHAKASERKRLDAMRAREDKASDAIFAWLDEHSPRCWRVGCPAHWICSQLTYADAITADRLSVVPPACYGAYPGDAERFAAPVRQQELTPAW